MPPSLADQIYSSLLSLPAIRTFNVNVLISVPRKCHTLFPYADEKDSPKVYIQDILVLLSEDASVNEQEGINETSNKARFVSAIEPNLFTIPSSSCSLLY